MTLPEPTRAPRGNGVSVDAALRPVRRDPMTPFDAKNALREVITYPTGAPVLAVARGLSLDSLTDVAGRRWRDNWLIGSDALSAALQRRMRAVEVVEIEGSRDVRGDGLGSSAGATKPTSPSTTTAAACRDWIADRSCPPIRRAHAGTLATGVSTPTNEAIPPQRPSRSGRSRMSAPMSSTLVKSLCSLGVPGEPALQDGGPGQRRWLLTLRDGELAHRVLLSGPPALLGTSEVCDILVDDPRFEPIHLQIAPHDDGAIFRAGGAQGFDCHGRHQTTEADVGWGTPVFVEDLLMLTIDPWHDG